MGGCTQLSFQELKTRLSFTPILNKPIKGRHFQLHKYLSDLGIGTIFTQLNEENWEFVVAYVTMSKHVK